jgi:hypothetical protein
VSKTLYSKDGQTAFLKANAISFPQGSTSTESCAPRSAPCYGAIEVKAAWKLLGPGDDPTQFYTVVATLTDPATGNEIPDMTMGLVGLHIITWTSSASPGTGSPSQGVWSTFEHVANAPDAPPPPFAAGALVEPLAGNYFNFNNPTESQPPNGFGFEPPPLSPGQKPPENPTPTQITRVVNNVCINGAWTQALNSTMQAELAGTVWANYRLVSTQWPFGDPPVPQGCAAGVFCPGNLTNTTMETYMQRGGSCMGCHSFAKTAGTLPTPPGGTASANFSYLLQQAQAANAPPAVLRSRR